MDAIKTLQQAIIHFADAENCRQFMVSLRWEDDIVRSHSAIPRRSTISKRRSYTTAMRAPEAEVLAQGRHRFGRFTHRPGEVASGHLASPNCKNGISSYELAKTLGVTQKSAWFMLHRIRLAMENGAFAKLGGSARWNG